MIDPPTPHDVSSSGRSRSGSPTATSLKERVEHAIRNDDPIELSWQLNFEKDALDILIEFELQEGIDQITVTRDVTALAFAAALDRTRMVQLLLSQGANVHAKIPGYQGTALHIAAQYGSKGAIQHILSNGANINQQDKYGSSALHLASWYGREQVVAYLLGANIDIGLLDRMGHTAFHNAAWHGQTGILRLLYERGSSAYIDVPSANFNTPLHLAALRNCYDAAEALVSWGANVNQPGEHGASPLHVACQHGDAKFVRLLIRHGAQVSAVDDDGDTCMHYIVRHKEDSLSTIEEMVSDLVGRGLDVNLSNNQGLSPLFLACDLEKSEHVECLLKYHADVNTVGSSGKTALMEACGRDNDQIVNTLLKRNADTAAKDNHGLTALEVACLSGFIKNVRALLSKGAKAIVYDVDGKTPLSRAVENGHFDIALELLATEDYHPQKPTGKSRYTERIDPSPELASWLLKNFDLPRFQELEQLHTIMCWAVSTGAVDLAHKCIDQNHEVLHWSSGGITWLHIASENGQVEMAELLLLMTAKEQESELRWTKVNAITKKNSRGNSPLKIAIDRGEHKLQKQFWADIRELRKDDIPKETYRTDASRILEFLAEHEEPGHEVILKEFLRQWFDETVVEDTQGYTALHWAAARNQVAVVWWLLSRGGYSSDGTIESVRKLVLSQYKNNDPRHGDLCDHIRNLLMRPPPILHRVSDPNKEHTATFPKVNHPRADTWGHIVDILSDGEMITIPYAKHTIDDIIYHKGPDSLMKKVKDDLRHRDLDALRRESIRTTPERKEDGRSSSPGMSGITYPHSSDSVGWVPSRYEGNDEDESSDNTHLDRLLRWIHLPVNELHLMQDLVSRLSDESKRSEAEHAALMKHFNRSWFELAAGGSHRYMKPQCVRPQKRKRKNVNEKSNDERIEGGVSGEHNPCAALYMPYLTTGSYFPRNNNPNTPQPQILDQSNNNRDSRRIKHTPITLDQYYYPTIRDTSERDNDQVLAKYLQKKSTEEPHPTARKEILMVNHLWVWIIDEKTIITATTENSDQRSYDGPLKHPPNSLLEATIDSILYGETPSRLEHDVSAYSVMELVVKTATGFFRGRSVGVSGEDTRGSDTKGPLEIFRESIRDVADQEASLFRKFLDGLRRETHGRPKQHKKPASQLQGTQKPLNRHHVISSETELLGMIRHLRDELHILRSLAEDQGNVWNQAFATDGPEQFEYCTPSDVQSELREMLAEADKAEKYINALLDLRQVEFSRLQAYDTARQSSSIFILTIITIVFLPLLFLTSLFSLDISSFPHASGSLKYPAYWIFPILFGVTAVISIPVIILAWNANKVPKKLQPRNDIDYGRRQTGGTMNDDIMMKPGVARTWQGNLRRRFRKGGDNEDPTLKLA